MKRWVGRTALVTGASAGIGAAVAERLTKAGMTVIGCARNIQAIEDLSTKLSGQPGRLYATKCDITKEDEILSMFADIKTKFGGVDVCINNAGLSHAEPLLSGNTDKWRHMLEVNVLGLSICTREAYTSMKERSVDDGQIIHIASMSSHRVVNNKNGHMYSATKFAVRALLEGLRQELREVGSHIRVACVSPGLVATEFQARSMGEESAERLYSSIKCLEAPDIADAVEYIMTAPPHVQVHDVLLRPTEQNT